MSPPLSVKEQVQALLLLQEVAGERTWAAVTTAVAAAAEAQGHDADTAALMGQYAAHSAGLKVPRDTGKPRGGARSGAGRKPYPDFGPGAVVIEVRSLVATISRWQRVNVAFQLQPAINCEELVDAAEEEVRSIGGDIAVPGIYPCSPALAALAEWE